MEAGNYASVGTLFRTIERQAMHPEHMEWIESLQDDLEKFDRILLFSGEMQRNVMQDFCRSKALKKASKKVLVLFHADISCPQGGNCEVRRISEEEHSTLEQLYRTYEFSDRFQIITDQLQWGSLMNYVKTGIMTAEEFFEALLS